MNMLKYFDQVHILLVKNWISIFHALVKPLLIFKPYSYKIINIPQQAKVEMISCYVRICTCGCPAWGKQKQHLRDWHIVFQGTK